ALAFAKPPDDCVGVQVIVPGRGLCPPGTGIDLAGLRAIAGIPVDPGERRYTGPLQRDAARLAERLHPTDAVVLLGSIATAKYLEPLKEVLGPRLRVPREFIGRGDMSRGALMLRCASEGRELTYIQGSEPVLGPKRSSARCCGTCSHSVDWGDRRDNRAGTRPGRDFRGVPGQRIISPMASVFEQLNGPWHKRTLRVFMIIVIVHLAEHLVQAYQAYVLAWPLHQARGILGQAFPWLVHSEVL